MNNSENQLNELFEAKAHLGHKTSRVHPKSKKYIYTVQNGVSIIDLTITVDLLKKALEFVEKIAKENKTMLMVATKKVASAKIQELCQKSSLPYVTTKWPAGLLSNFETIMKNIKKLNQMKKDRADGAWQKFVKHDRMRLEKEIIKLERGYGGLAQLTKLPDALFIVDIKKEKNAVGEALKMPIPIVAITDTNVDPQQIDYPIPANDDSLSSIEYIVNKVTETYAKYRKDQKTDENKSTISSSS